MIIRTLNQFKLEHPEYTGYILVYAGFFVDKKLEEMLIDKKVTYIKLNYNELENDFLKFLEPGIGPCLIYLENGEIAKKLLSLVSSNKLNEWLGLG